jgi:hypothetical protein
MTVPPRHPANPGHTTLAGVSFGPTSTTEEIDLLQIFAACARAKKHELVARENWFEHPESGLVIQPLLAGIGALDGGGVRTTTTIQVDHPDRIPRGVFEFQHSAAKTATLSIERGFTEWLETDFVALLDSGREKPAICPTMLMSYPATAESPARKRRVVLGPALRFAERPDAEDSHPFCACCLFTNSLDTFDTLLRGTDFFGLRLYVSRDREGTTNADCRVNGETWEPGAAALRAYAGTWTSAGVEWRKQYVILETRPAVATSVEPV